MSVKHRELVVEDKSYPFAHCKLGREKYAKVLTEIIKAYHTGFVLAINSRWGTGKTSFIKMWEQDLKNQSLQTIYFNAWENDFEDNPLVALMGELKTITQETNKEQFKKALKSAATLSKHIIPLAAQAIADRYINTQLLRDTIVSITEGTTDIFENEVNDYANKKASIKEFRKSLSEFISETNSAKPLIFFIDELDRCRPNYAVSILEQIKHFFSVPNIVFILSIDKVQLGNAVRGVYGSDKIDSDEYLRRFIDIEYSLPSPEKGTYYNYLYTYFEFDNFFKSTSRNDYRELKSDSNEFLQMAEILFDDTPITLRQQEKIFAHARLALRSFKINEYVVPIIFLLLTYIKLINEELYNQIRSKTLSLKELQKEFKLIVGSKLTQDQERSFMWVEAQLVLYYNNSLYNSYNRNNIYINDETGKKLILKSVISPTKDIDFIETFERIDSNKRTGHLDLGHFINKIDLTANVQL
ncbi:KAP family P-loop NTPase fold protein [Pontibacter roseus]|uniref:KAP family P-loop NTPase fold protein n=1 Tax=Pontibacter roseus TaxID=336989 RepID=UPI00036C04E5|nr:P-loop NTPase fold protein [Pontibacter roseus]